MAYEIKLTDDAERDLNRLDIVLQSLTESHLMSLGDHPSALSRSAVSPPYPPGDMISETFFDIGDGRRHFITVFFQYSQDETSLNILRIGHVRY